MRDSPEYDHGRIGRISYSKEGRLWEIYQGPSRRRNWNVWESEDFSSHFAADLPYVSFFPDVLDSHTFTCCPTRVWRTQRQSNSSEPTQTIHIQSHAFRSSINISSTHATISSRLWLTMHLCLEFRLIIIRMPWWPYTLHNWRPWRPYDLSISKFLATALN